MRGCRGWSTAQTAVQLGDAHAPAAAPAHFQPTSDETHSRVHAGDSRWLLTGSADSSVRLWSVSNGQELFNWDTHCPARGVAFSAGEKLAAFTTDPFMLTMPSIRLIKMNDDPRENTQQPLLQIDLPTRFHRCVQPCVSSRVLTGPHVSTLVHTAPGFRRESRLEGSIKAHACVRVPRYTTRAASSQACQEKQYRVQRAGGHFGRGLWWRAARRFLEGVSASARNPCRALRGGCLQLEHASPQRGP